MENLDYINTFLIDQFGIDTVTGQPIWRVVWSEDQFEKRLGTYSDYTTNGLFIREITEVREVPKYRQWITEKYVLERLVVIPEINKNDLPTTNLSYEPIFIFEDNNGNYLPPRVDVAKLIVDTIYAALGKKSLAKYVDEEAKNDPKRLQAIKDLQEELFGNETPVTDALAYREGVVVPHNFKKEN